MFIFYKFGLSINSYDVFNLAILDGAMLTAKYVVQSFTSLMLTKPCSHNQFLNINYTTHWGRVTHICVSELTITGSDNGLSPDRHQAIIWTSAGTLLTGPFSEILIKIQNFFIRKTASEKNVLCEIAAILGRGGGGGGVGLRVNYLTHDCWSTICIKISSLTYAPASGNSKHEMFIICGSRNIIITHDENLRNSTNTNDTWVKDCSSYLWKPW